MPTYTSQYPPAQSSTYVKATSYYTADYYPHFTTDPTKSLIGSFIGNAWLSGLDKITDQRFHIDLGSAKIIRRIYYENVHHIGTSTDMGARNFTFWGSNTAGSFAELTYGIDTGWIQLAISQSYFDQHIAADQTDPKYITVTNSTEYRYYAFKFADNYGNVVMGARRIELQTEDGYEPPEIDIGMPASDRGTFLGSYTFVNKGNPANANGKITSVEIWAYATLSNCEVATFYRPSPALFPNNLSTRDTHAIGTVTAGSKQTFGVNLDVQVGDYIGIYYSAGSLEVDSAGGDGIWFLSAADHIPCTNQLFNSAAGWMLSIYGTGIELPDPPTNVQATNGTYTGYVRITWTKSSGATGYQVYRDGTPLGWLGDVALYNDSGAGAPTVTHGTVSATDGNFTAYVALENAGASTNNGTTHTYKVRAKKDSVESGDSGTDTGYRGVGTLEYQWFKSAGDSDADYSPISGATASTYNDTAAPAPTITPGTASASDGTSSDYVTLSIAGESANVGAGRYYKCYHTAIGIPSEFTEYNRGYRGVGALTYQWQRSAADSDANYSNISGGTTDPYNDTEAPADGSGRYFKCIENAIGASQQTTNADRGYRIPAGIKWNGVTITKWNGKVISKWNGVG